MARLISVLVVVAAGLSWAEGAARADLAPRDACTSPGQPCQVAGPNYDQAGVCQTWTCTKGLPDGDGGVTTTSYVCNRCQPSGAGGAEGGAGAAGTSGTAGTSGVAGATGAAGSTGAAGTGVPGAGGGAAGGAPATTPKSSSGCNVAGSGGGPDLTALLLVASMFARRLRAANR